MDERYFAERQEGDLGGTQFVKADIGHAHSARLAFGKCVREFAVRKPQTFFSALRELLAQLAKKGYGQHQAGWRVTGGKTIPFEKLTHAQIFGTWASVQRVLSDWIYDLLTLYGKLPEEGKLVFKGNDVHAVMHLLFQLTYRTDIFVLPPNDLEGEVMKCLGV
jgi:hypothetical protein